MKKTVSINIGGIIFHIEEDGYDKLKNYLDSVNKYFSTFEDSGEIISDIESRIAEIFLDKLSDGRQTVTLEDVEGLIATMGTTQDFEAAIETEPVTTEAPKSEESQQSSSTTAEEPQSSEQPKKLVRDMKRRILGGVAAGIAHYFSIDPLWIRLLLLLMFINVFFGGLSAAIFLAYIILWIVLPQSESLEEDKKVKKLFRNSDQRVLGGVASGIAAYFGTDISVIRLLFVLSIFLGGAGIILYIILWIITPEAKTITEKMQMQGEPVTLSNIEENVKKGLNVREGEESAFVKVLLFPFRLIALVISGLAKALGPILGFLVQAIRILFGLILVLLGFSVMISLIISALAALGIGAWDAYVQWGDFPVDLFRRSISNWALFSTFLVAFIPALSIALVGLVVILKRTVANAYVGWSLFGIWFIALLISMFSIPRFVRDFAVEDDIRIDKQFALTEATPTLRLNDEGFDTFDAVDLRIRGHEDSTYQVIINIESRGGNREEARENARQVIYEVEQKGDDIYFDSRIQFEDEAEYRFQNVDITFYVPYGKTFRMDQDLDEIIVNTLHINGYRAYQMGSNDWVFDQDGLQCVTCAPRRSKSYGSYSSDDDRAALDRDSKTKRKYEDSESISFPMEDFNEVVIASYFDVDIRKGDDYSISVKGKDRFLDEVYVNQVGDKLEVKYREDNWRWWRDRNEEKVALIITMPELEYLEMSGDCDGEIVGFNNDEITIKVTGESELFLDLYPRELELELTGAAEVEVRGAAHEATVELLGASNYKGFGFIAKRISLDAVGASKAEVYGEDEIEIDAAGVSKVRYRGTSNVRISKAGVTSVSRD